MKSGESAVVFGVTEDRLDRFASLAVKPSAVIGVEDVSHPVIKPAAPATPRAFALAGVRRDQDLEVLVADDLVDVLLVPVARISDDELGGTGADTSWAKKSNQPCAMPSDTSQPLHRLE